MHQHELKDYVTNESDDRLPLSRLLWQHLSAVYACANNWTSEDAYVFEVKAKLLDLSRSKEDGRGYSHPLDNTNQWGHTALAVASNHGHAQAVKLLLAHGADPNKAELGSWSPLHHAAHHNRIECVRLLLEAGADRSHCHCTSGTPRRTAKKAGHLECAKLLSTKLATSTATVANRVAQPVLLPAEIFVNHPIAGGGPRDGWVLL